ASAAPDLALLRRGILRPVHTGPRGHGLALPRADANHRREGHVRRPRQARRRREPHRGAHDLRARRRRGVAGAELPQAFPARVRVHGRASGPQHRREVERRGLTRAAWTNMSDDIVKIEVNGVPLEARKGEMLIEVTDRAGIYIPRFCYHHKLSVAANCRMCLVDIEKAPKPMPACATPVADGMKVYTRSKRAIDAQKATMEFLLINHPLDCPICDQGGECELQ